MRILILMVLLVMSAQACAAAPAFLALGDSYTIGEGVPPDQRWPEQLVARLHEQNVAVGDPQIIARTGWTTDELARAMDAARFHPPYALVTLMIGVNNQYRGRPLDEYRVQFHALLTRAIALAGDKPRHVLVISTPDWGVTLFARREKRDAATIANRIDAFNAAAQQETQAAGARWVDVTTISRAAEVRHSLTSDGLHPDAEQYARWVAAILPAARSVLESQHD